jgi:hypothetical protein
MPSRLPDRVLFSQASWITQESFSIATTFALVSAAALVTPRLVAQRPSDLPGLALVGHNVSDLDVPLDRRRRAEQTGRYTWRGIADRNDESSKLGLGCPFTLVLRQYRGLQRHRPDYRLWQPAR